MEVEDIYVYLKDEGVNVWRPVKAHRIEGTTYLILPDQAVPKDETWQFPPGSIVVCEEKELSGGLSKVALKLLPQTK